MHEMTLALICKGKSFFCRLLFWGELMNKIRSNDSFLVSPKHDKHKNFHEMSDVILHNAPCLTKQFLSTNSSFRQRYPLPQRLRRWGSLQKVSSLWSFVSKKQNKNVRSIFMHVAGHNEPNENKYTLGQKFWTRQNFQISIASHSLSFNRKISKIAQ